MANNLRLTDPQVLTGLSTALGRFVAAIQQELQAASMEIDENQAWLQQRVHHWQAQLSKAEQEVARATNAVRRCQASASRDAQGRTRQPDCQAEKQELARAEKQFRECQANLRTAQTWQQRISQSVIEYQRESQRLRRLSADHTAEARSRLGQLSIRYAAVHSGGHAVASRIGEEVLRQLNVTRPVPILVAPMHFTVNAKYRKTVDAIYISDDFVGVTESQLLEPLIAHEGVHALYQSDDPFDEASLQALLDEEMVAHRVQLETWQRVSPTLDVSHLSPISRELFMAHRQLGERVAKPDGWKALRAELEADRRIIMSTKQS